GKLLFPYAQPSTPYESYKLLQNQEIGQNESNYAPCNIDYANFLAPYRLTAIDLSAIMQTLPDQGMNAVAIDINATMSYLGGVTNADIYLIAEQEQVCEINLSKGQTTTLTAATL
ncbi:MAG: hypothetical protein JWL77_6954, partial [Chthonomonadaceae bacterium]|nr:hypothetical protein [Chthonomonadaceae bacterium]